MPDDAYVTMPNQLGIDYFDLADAEGEQVEHMASADLRSWMREHHLDLTLIRPEVIDDIYEDLYYEYAEDDLDDVDAFEDSEDASDDEPDFLDVLDDVRERVLAGDVFNPREAFGSHSDSDHVYNTPRAGTCSAA